MSIFSVLHAAMHVVKHGMTEAIQFLNAGSCDSPNGLEHMHGEVVIHDDIEMVMCISTTKAQVKNKAIKVC